MNHGFAAHAAARLCVTVAKRCAARHMNFSAIALAGPIRAAFRFDLVQHNEKSKSLTHHPFATSQGETDVFFEAPARPDRTLTKT